MIAYAAGRVAVSAASERESWAKRAEWLVAVLSVLGMVEVFVFGEGPRTLLYLAVEQAATENGALVGSYHVRGLQGFENPPQCLGRLRLGPCVWLP